MTNARQPRSAAGLKTVLDVLFASLGFVALRLLITPVRIKLLTSLLSKADYGLLTFVMLIISFVTLVSSLGSIEFLMRKLPGRDEDYQFGVLRTVMTWFGAAACVIALAGAAFLIVARPEKLPLTPSQAVAGGLLLVLTVHLTQLVYFLLGRGAYSQSRLLMLLYTDAWFLPLLAFAWSGRVTVGFMLWLWVAWLFLSILFSQIYVPARRVLRCPASRDTLRSILAFGVPLLPVIMGEWIFQIQDRFVILGFMNLESLANYTLCFNIAWVGVSTGTSVVDVLLTEFFKLRNRNPSHRIEDLLADAALRRSFSVMLRYALAIALPIAAALWFAGLPMILLLSDPKFADAAHLMRWVTPMPILYLLFVIAGRTMMALDRGAAVGGATLAAALGNLVLSMFFVPWLGERGAALSGCLSYAVLALYLSSRCRFLAWIDWHELRPWRLAALVLISSLGFLAAVRWIEAAPLIKLLVGGLPVPVALFGLGLVRKSDLHMLMESMHGNAS